MSEDDFDDDFCGDCDCDPCECRFDDDDYDDPIGMGDDYLIDRVGFADPGGRSALRAETPSNPRDCDCPTCGARGVLTRLDKRAGYQCDRCADAAERGY